MMPHFSTINPLSPHASRLNGFFHRLESYNQIARQIDSGRGKNSAKLIPAKKLSSLTVYLFWDDEYMK